MELIVTILVALPLGFFVRSRVAAYVAFIAIHSFVFSYQCMELILSGSAATTARFPRTPGPGPGTTPWSI